MLLTVRAKGELLESNVSVPDGADEITVQGKIKKACKDLQEVLGGDEEILIVRVERKW